MQDATIQQLKPHIARYGQMEQMLTDPNRLAAYTVDFFTHVHPVQNQQPQPQFQRPEFPGGAPSGGGGRQFSLAQVRPDQRWQVADQMERQGMFQGKVLIGE